ncbi:tRNA preQ1(34) S-adenosylmethionine ribosyltransferase-isomerase QueA [Bdellovibrionota bacterium FG-1]
MTPPHFFASSYSFDLPEELIAQQPVTPRDSSRLMVVDRARGTWVHRTFSDLPEYLSASDLCVANNTRVMKARLLGKRLKFEQNQWITGGNVEFVMLEQVAPLTWEGLFKASARYVPGVRFEIPTPDGRGLRGTLIRGSKESASGTVVAEFDRDPLESGAGEIPLPHYIRRAAGGADDSSYQTLFAKEPGSAAAPTAGLHFTQDVLSRLNQQGVGWEEVTLNVGLGTFRPVKVDDIREHVMHDERYEILPNTAERVNDAKKTGHRIVAIGTTSVRTLESAADPDTGKVRSGVGRTAIFIYPGFQFKVVDRMLTNFHLPQSTLLMLVSAFAGRELVLEAYRAAVREKYRFFSYGDAMLIL